jgi:micrococcal nuclease
VHLTAVLPYSSTSDWGLAMRWFLISLPLFLIGSAPAPPKVTAEFDAKVVGISDGDTLTVLKNREQIKIRLEGIDTPEKAQAFGSKAKSALADLVASKTISVHQTGTDKYGRTLARVIVDGDDVSESLVTQGMAWHYKEYSTDETLASLEDKARAEKIGLWSESNALPPWEFRKRQRGNNRPTVGSDVPAVAEPGPSTSDSLNWLNTSSNVRHNASCQYFKNTKKGRLCGPNEGKACGACGG